ncbi:MAG TPA: AsmA family protein, partial [Trinickia sp.]|nr:AsmA family protein [Trinickia sp.]
MPLHRNGLRTTGKILAAAALVVLLIGAVFALIVATFDWNFARPWVDDKVSQAIGRPFAINGDLRLGWQHPANEHGWRAWVPWPRFSAKNVTLDNPSWAKSPRLASADEISFNVEVLPLLAHTLSVPSISLVNPSIDLERLADGRDNWTFHFAPSPGKTHWTVRLSELSFAKGDVSLSDEIKRVELRVGVDTLGQPVAIGDVLKQQEASSRGTAGKSAEKAPRPHGARRFGAAHQGAASGESATPSAQVVSSAPA